MISIACYKKDNMKKLFPEYYTLNDVQVRIVWDDAIIVFDTNTLLNLYRYTDTTRNDFLDVLEFYKERLWLPYQVAMEFQRNRINPIIENEASYDKLISKLHEQSEKMIKELKLDNYTRHPQINTEDIRKRILKLTDSIVDSLKQKRDATRIDLNNDQIYKFVTKLFESRVGQDFGEEELKRIYGEGKVRYEHKIPPGYCDEKDKRDFGERYVYGDLIIWKQVMAESVAKKVDVIFVTDDHKEDWWIEKCGRTIGPRYELIKEFADNTGQKVMIYNALSFLEHAKENKAIRISKKTINEITKVKVGDTLRIKKISERMSEILGSLEDNNIKIPQETIIKYLNEHNNTLKQVQDRMNWYDRMPRMMESYYEIRQNLDNINKMLNSGEKKEE